MSDVGAVSVEMKAEVNIPIPTERDWAKIAGEVGNLALLAVRENFWQGGRPDKWLPLVTGMPSFLMQSGALYESVQMTVREEGEDYISRIATTGGLPYPEIHQFGGTINHPGSKKAVPLMINGELQFRVMGPHTITIQARPFMVLTEEDEKALGIAAVGRIVEIMEAVKTKTTNKGEEF